MCPAANGRGVSNLFLPLAGPWEKCFFNKNKDKNEKEKIFCCDLLFVLIRQKKFL
jgi:hypothetical protein